MTPDPESAGSDLDGLLETVDSVDADVLREFVKAELQKDSGFADRFRTYVSDTSDVEAQYTEAIEEALDANRTSDGTITGKVDLDPLLDRAQVTRERGDVAAAMEAYRAIADTLAKNADQMEGNEVGSSESYWHYESYVYTALDRYESCLSKQDLSPEDRRDLLTELVTLLPEVNGYFKRYHRLVNGLAESSDEWAYLWTQIREHEAYPDADLTLVFDVFAEISPTSEDREFVLDGIITDCINAWLSPSWLDKHETVCEEDRDYEYLLNGLCEAADIPAAPETAGGNPISAFVVQNKTLRGALLSLTEYRGHDIMRLQLLRANAEQVDDPRTAEELLSTLLEELVTAGEYEEAIAVFETIGERTAPNGGLSDTSTDDRERVLDAYEAVDPVRHRLLLTGLLFDTRSVEYYELLVNASPRDRSFVREAFLQKCELERQESVIEGLSRPVTYYSLTASGSTQLMEVEILLNDGLVERALSVLEQQVSLGAVKKYRDAFETAFPDRYYDVYKDAIEKKATSTGRDTYQTISRECLVLLELPAGSEDDVTAFVNQLLETYDNRPAFHDEMSYFESQSPISPSELHRQE